MDLTNGKHDLFLEYLKQDGHQNDIAFFFYLSYLFQNIDLKSKRILEIGSGKGIMSIFVGLSGAREVVSLEPEMDGSTNKSSELQQKRIKALELENVNLINKDFESFVVNYQDTEFDYIFSFQSINHIFETEKKLTRHSREWHTYLDIGKKIRKLLVEDGIAIISDACRSGFFYKLKKVGINRPWRPNKRSNVNWKVHQNPDIWQNLFLQAGFSNVSIKYPLPYKLRKLGRLVANPVINYFLTSKFILYCTN